MEKLQLLYEQMIEDDELMQELEEIIQLFSRQNEKTLSTVAQKYMNL